MAPKSPDQSPDRGLQFLAQVVKDKPDAAWAHMAAGRVLSTMPDDELPAVDQPALQSDVTAAGVLEAASPQVVPTAAGPIVMPPPDGPATRTGSGSGGKTEVVVYSEKRERQGRRPGKRTKQESKKRQAWKRAVSDADAMLAACPELPDYKPEKMPEVPAWMDQMVGRIIVDYTGKMVEYYAQTFHHWIGVALIKKAALAEHETEDGKVVRRYAFRGNSPGSVRARTMFAYGLLHLASSRPTDRNGAFHRLVSGRSVRMFCWVLRNRFTGVPMSVNSLTGTHDTEAAGDAAKGEKYLTGRVGYNVAFREVGFFQTRQLRWSSKDGAAPEGGFSREWKDVQGFEVAGKGRVDPKTGRTWRVSLNRYWVVTDDFLRPASLEKEIELYRLDSEGRSLVLNTPTANGRQVHDPLGPWLALRMTMLADRIGVDQLAAALPSEAPRGLLEA